MPRYNYLHNCLIIKKRQQIGKKPLDEVWFIVCKCAQSQDSSSPNMLHAHNNSQQYKVETIQYANKPQIYKQQKENGVLDSRLNPKKPINQVLYALIKHYL